MTMYRSEQLKKLLSDRRILIAGYGREGQSTHALMQQILPSQQVDIAHNDEEIVARLKVGDYDCVIKSPGIPNALFEGRCPMDRLTSLTDIFLQVYGDQTIGITGTKGKSSTTSLIHHVLSVQSDKLTPSRDSSNILLAGNIGIPLFDIIPQMDQRSIVVAELSCHQLQNIHRAPHIAILLNLYQEHLDHYHDYRDYQLAKLNIALKQREGDCFLYCSDNEELAARVEEFRQAMQGSVTPYCLAGYRDRVADFVTSLKGDHNLSNIVVAMLACGHYGIGDADFAAALASFKGLEHRMEFVATKNDISFYNDSISTIPEACEAAVEALGSVDTLILGGFDRGIDYSGLARYLAKCSVRNFVFVGQAGRRIFEAMKPLRSIGDAHLLQSDDYKAIVDWCYAHTLPGCICLLSPAAASYDAFKNFEHRGRTFKQLVLDHQ